jgi:hypothetical protein
MADAYASSVDLPCPTRSAGRRRRALRRQDRRELARAVPVARERVPSTHARMRDVRCACRCVGDVYCDMRAFNSERRLTRDGPGHTAWCCAWWRPGRAGRRRAGRSPHRASALRARARTVPRGAVATARVPHSHAADPADRAHARHRACQRAVCARRPRVSSNSHLRQRPGALGKRRTATPASVRRRVPVAPASLRRVNYPRVAQEARARHLERLPANEPSAAEVGCDHSVLVFRCSRAARWVYGAGRTAKMISRSR